MQVYSLGLGQDQPCVEGKDKDVTGIKQRKQLPPALCSPHPLEGEHHDDKLGLDKGHLHMTKQPGTGGEPLQQGYMWHRLSGGADLLPHCAYPLCSKM